MVPQHLLDEAFVNMHSGGDLSSASSHGGGARAESDNEYRVMQSIFSYNNKSTVHVRLTNRNPYW